MPEAHVVVTFFAILFCYRADFLFHRAVFGMPEEHVVVTFFSSDNRPLLWEHSAPLNIVPL